MRRSRLAFTIAELLVSVAITSILVVLLASVVSAALGAWRQGRNRLDTFSTARQVITRIGDEVSAALASAGGIEFRENQAALGSAGAFPGANTSENVFFVAPYPNKYVESGTDVAAGDLCVIAYRHNASERRLERAFVDSYRAWNVAAAKRYKLDGYNNLLQWKTVAEGVLEFELRSYSRETPETLAPTWDSAGGTAAMAGKTPRRVVVRVKVVDDRTAQRIKSLSVAAAAGSAREFFAEFSLPAR